MTLVWRPIIAADDISVKLIELLTKVWAYLTGLAPGNKVWSIILAVFVLGVALLLSGYLFLSAIAKLLEASAKALDSYKNSGLPVPADAKQRVQVRRRSQFCAVLNADLAYLAKAENWNDQYFTDLEAEVETEGRYYRSVLSRWRSRKSSGLRRVSSLIKAIDLSAERTILLVGEPGSGKSVALRHLAKQLAERAQRSKDPNALIPLYVNLREFGRVASANLDADYIKRFVLDNIRRGDADTTAYVRDNWDDYRERGLWFFLFDSFDEIPDVLHAATGSPDISHYSAAIRQFLDGMGTCRGVLASREFKGPESLPWQRFRIMELSESRQNELIANSFLDPDEMTIVRRYVAASENNLGSNPLFLTLFCRHVKETHQALANDHDLLARHIERLAAREPDYLARTYGLTPAELLSGAQELAAAFAEDPTLSLAPTRDELAMSIGQRPLSINSLDNLLAALVDVKIGRSDVPHSRPGDRRFAFSHRRYQETLFVRHLANNPSYLTPRDLLTRTTWREYAVTFLQTQDVLKIRPLLRTAANLLNERAAQQVVTPIVDEIGISATTSLGFFQWLDEPSVPVLSLLQEGLARRLGDTPSWLVEAVDQFLTPRWRHGDYHDRTNVVRYGGLLPGPTLREYLAYAFDHGTPRMQGLAFRQAVYLTDATATLGRQIRMQLANAVLLSGNRASVLRLEALAARLPDSMDARNVIPRARILKAMSLNLSFLGFASSIFRRRNYTLESVLSYTLQRMATPFDSVVLATIVLIGPLYILSGTMILLTSPDGPFGNRSNLHGVAWATIGLANISFVLCAAFLFLTRSYGSLSKFNDFFAESVRAWRPRRDHRHFEMILVFVAICALSLIIAKYDAVVAALLAVLVAIYATYRFGRQLIIVRNQRRNFRELRKATASDFSIVQCAGSVEELATWFEVDFGFFSGDTGQIRSLSSLLLNAQGAERPAILAALPWLARSRDSHFAIDALSRPLEDRLLGGEFAIHDLLSRTNDSLIRIESSTDAVAFDALREEDN